MNKLMCSIAFAVLIALFAPIIAMAGNSPTIEAPKIVAMISIDSNGAKKGDDISGSLTFSISEGWHVYAPGAPKVYKPLAISLDANSPVTELTVDFPEAKVLEVLGEKIPVYEGPITILFSGKLSKEAPTTWNPVISWQACSDLICMAPDKTTIEVKLTKN